MNHTNSNENSEEIFLNSLTILLESSLVEKKESGLSLQLYDLIYSLQVEVPTESKNSNDNRFQIYST